VIAGLKYFVTEAFTSLWRGRRSSVLSILTITIALFMLGLFLLLSENLERMVAEWGRSAEFSVYLQDAATTAERAVIEASLRADPTVAGFEAVSKEAALARFRRDFPELAPAMDGASENPFPASLEARLASPSVTGAALEKMARRIGTMPGVADVRYDRRWLDRLASVGRVIRWGGLTLAAVLILAAALTVTNVVRLALYARRDEVEIMELVGAPMTFIRGPFVFEGIIQGGIGALLALLLLRVGLGIARPRLASLAAGIVDVPSVEFLAGSTVAIMVLGGMVVGCLGGLVAARRLR
jgi:cell division transport system permease protein